MRHCLRYRGGCSLLTKDADDVFPLLEQLDDVLHNPFTIAAVPSGAQEENDAGHGCRA